MMLASTDRLELGAVDRRAGRAGHRSHRPDVIEVGVGDQDRLDGLDPERVDGLDQPLGLVAWVDDQRAIGALLAHDEAVLLHRPDGEHPHVDHLVRRSPSCAFCAGTGNISM